MHAPRSLCVRAGRPRQPGAASALAERRRRLQRAAAAPAAPAAPRAKAAPAAAEPAAAPHAHSNAASGSAPARAPFGRREPATAAPAAERVPGSRLCDVPDDVLRADLVLSMRSTDDVVSLVAGTCRAGWERRLNGSPLCPDEVYRAWCAERAASRAEVRAVVWQRVFSALSNARTGKKPSGAGAAVKNYCNAFLLPYLEAHPLDDDAAPREAPPARGAQATLSIENVPSSVPATPPRGCAPEAAPALADSCPPTPRVARGAESDRAATAAAAAAAQAAQVAELRAKLAELAHARALVDAADALRAAALQARVAAAAKDICSQSASTSTVDVHNASDSDDTAADAESAAPGGKEQDVVYQYTVHTRADGVQVIIID